VCVCVCVCVCVNTVATATSAAVTARVKARHAKSVGVPSGNGREVLVLQVGTHLLDPPGDVAWRRSQ
jgi:hypothetical protein